MTALLVDGTHDASELRRALYAGDLVLRTNVDAVFELVDFARGQLTALFDPYPAEEVHLHLTPEAVAALLATWKPSFIHHQHSKTLVRKIIEEVGFPPDRTHFDVPKPRTAFPVGHLSTGIAFAFPWHRDTWYGAPPQQINWWLPVFDVRPDNAMRFDPAQFARAVPNSSEAFDYYEANVARRTTATQVRAEIQPRPAALDHHPDDELVVVAPPGSVLLFSAGHLHATVPNTSGRSRYSVDFRTVDRDDVESGTGAPTPDVACTGTALRDFVNVADGSRFDEGLVQRLYGPPPSDAVLVFDPRDQLDASSTPDER